MFVYLLVVALLSFDADASRIALDHSQSREGTLELLLSLDAHDLKVARSAPLGFPLSRIALNEKIPFRERVLALRAMSILNCRSVAHTLEPLLTPRTNGIAIAVAREAALALYQLGDKATLKAGLGSRDPEVRSLAASSGAGGLTLCTLLSADPWPFVRASAAEGLAIHPGSGPCLLAALKQKHPKIRRAVVASLGEVTQPGAVSHLKALVLNTREDNRVRGAAIIALGNLGDITIARKILETHLRHGEMIEFARLAVLALNAAQAPAEVFLNALKSNSPTVILSAASALLKQDSTQFLKAIANVRPRLTGRFREQLDVLMSQPVGRESLGSDIVKDAPDDD